MNEPISNFFRVSHILLENEDFKKLPLFAKVIYFYLCKYRNRFQKSKAYFTRSESQIEKDTGITRKTIRKNLDILHEARFIFCKKSQGKRAKIQIFEPDVAIIKKKKKVLEFKRDLRRVK